MYKYHGYIIIESSDGVNVYDPDREIADRLIHSTDSVEQAMMWIDTQLLAKRKENAK